MTEGSRRKNKMYRKLRNYGWLADCIGNDAKGDKEAKVNKL